MIRYTITEVLLLVAGAIAMGVLMHQWYVGIKERYEAKKIKPCKRCTFITAD